jgi:hypothetical protein
MVPPEISAAQRWAIHGMLLVSSFAIYAIFRSMWHTTAGPAGQDDVDGSLFRSIVVLFVLPMFSFGAASWFQPRWRSRDAGRVATTVWCIASLGYMMAFGCPRVVLMVGLAFFPFCLGALIGHNVGRFHHPAHWDGIEMEFDD